VLCEDNRPLHPGHCAHYQIRQFGKGAYSHWCKGVYFSTSDNSDPRMNGRKYVLKRKDLLAVEKPDAEKVDTQILEERAVLRSAALQKLGLREVFDQCNSHQMRMGNGKAEILDFGILDGTDNRVRVLVSGTRYVIYFRALFYENVAGTGAGFLIRNIKGVDMFGVSLSSLGLPVVSVRKGDIFEARLAVTMWLTNGTYFLTVNTPDPYADTNVQYDSRFDGYEFDVAYKPGIFSDSMVDMEAKLDLKLL